jgi:hypothetical protein
LTAKLPALGSVGLSAYALARQLGGGAVFTAGLDFAYTPDIYHCRGSPSHLRLLRENTRLRCLYPLSSVYREGSFVYNAPDGSKLRKDPALEKYSNLFDELKGFTRQNSACQPGAGATFSSKQAALAAFADGERARLQALLDILTGTGEAQRLDQLLDECDYLWAHFPDCAGREGCRPRGDVNFLKRVRAEIEPFLALFRKACGRPHVL